MARAFPERDCDPDDPGTQAIPLDTAPMMPFIGNYFGSPILGNEGSPDQVPGPPPPFGEAELGLVAAPQNTNAGGTGGGELPALYLNGIRGPNAISIEDGEVIVRVEFGVGQGGESALNFVTDCLRI